MITKSTVYPLSQFFNVICLFKQISIFNIPNMKKKGVYNLAISYLAHKEKINYRHHRFSESVNNFMEESPVRYSQFELIHSKSYEVVGSKQLRIYRNRMKKQEKNKRDTCAKPSKMNQSCEENSKDELLNKQEVIQCLPILIKNQFIDILPDKMSNHLQKIKNAGTNSQILNILKKENIYKENCNWSMSRIKYKFNRIKNQWKKNNHCNKLIQKYPNTFESVELYRTKLEERQKNKNNTEINNHKNSIWPKLLRSSYQFTNVVQKKKLTRVLKNDNLTTKGNSKIKLESHWLQVKDQQGHKFKLLEEESLKCQKISY